MPTSTLTSKGQTTIPIDIQRLLQVEPGDKIQYFVELDGRVSLVPKTLSVKDLEAVLPKPPKAMSLKAIREAIQREATKEFSK